jgi:FkbM family methyltransferase
MAIHELLSFVWTHPLNAPQRFTALARVARWQVASRLVDGPIALPFVDDTSLLVSRGMKGATGNWYCGLHEVRDMAFVLHVLRAGDHFLDGGANVGSYTILAAGGAGARVTSVEPIANTVESLRRNVAVNGLADRVLVVQCGLDEAMRSRRFSSDDDTTNRILADDETHERSVDVPVVTIDHVVGDDAPAVIKLDLEGYEAAALRGAARILDDSRLLAIVMEMNLSSERYGVDHGSTKAMLEKKGFLPYAYDPFSRRLVDASHADGNVVFVRDRRAVETRVRTARRHRLITGEI